MGGWERSEMQRNREIEADFLQQKQEIKHNERTQTFPTSILCSRSKINSFFFFFPFSRDTRKLSTVFICDKNKNPAGNVTVCNIKFKTSMGKYTINILKYMQISIYNHCFPTYKVVVLGFFYKCMKRHHWRH